VPDGVPDGVPTWATWPSPSPPLLSAFGSFGSFGSLAALRDGLKASFEGEQVAVLAPPHGHVPLYRPRLPGALCRGSKTELPALPRPERSFWPHLDDVVRMTEVPISLPGARPFRSLSPEPRIEVSEPAPEEEPPKLPDFDMEAALAALRRERRRFPSCLPRGRPLGEEVSRATANQDGKDNAEDKDGQVGTQGEGSGESFVLDGRTDEGEAPHPSRPSRSPRSFREAPSRFAHAEAMILSSLRPRPDLATPSAFIMRPPVVELEMPSRQTRTEVSRRRHSTRRKLSATDVRSQEKFGKILVAHYEVRIGRKEGQKVTKSTKLMRVVLGVEEEKPESIVEGITVLQNAQKLIGVVQDEGPVARSRVTLRILSVVDRKAGARSSLADAVRALEELTSNEEKLLVDMVDFGPLEPAGQEADKKEHQEEFSGLLGNPNKLSSEAVKRAWEVVHHEAADWLPAKEKEKEKEKPEARQARKPRNKGKVEESAAVEKARQAHAMAVFRFAQAEAAGAEADELGENSLQKAARIEYAIKAACEAAVDPNHAELLKAWKIAYDLRAHRAYMYCLSLMKTIEPVLGSAGQVANEIDQVVQEAHEKYGVPKEHKDMEEARRLVLQARSEEAKVKRKEDAARRAKMSA